MKTSTMQAASKRIISQGTRELGSGRDIMGSCNICLAIIGYASVAVVTVFPADA